MDYMVQELHEDVMHIGELVKEAVAKANRALLQGDRTRGEEASAGDDLIDRMELAIARKCIGLLTSGQETRSQEHQEVTAILKVITELERIADLAEEVALISREISPPYPAKISQRLQNMAELASDSLQTGLHALATHDLSNLHHLREQEDTVDMAQRWLHAEILRHLQAAPDHLKTGVALLFTSHDLGRMADHATNIGEWALYSTTGDIGRLKSYRPSDFCPSLLPLL